MAYERVGMTSSIPVEVLFAAGIIPVDLNNIFITHQNPGSLIARAEEEGFPRNVCGWIKGIFATVLDNPDIKSVIAVTQGDCSNTHALMEVLGIWGKETIPFDFPWDRTYTSMKRNIELLMDMFGVDWESVKTEKKRLDTIRRALVRLDDMTWRDNLVHGQENHLFLVSSSDFESDPDEFARKVDDFIREAEESRKPFKDEVRLGYVGVPPIFSGFYEFIESLEARVVYNEIQRQFSMPYLTDDIVEQYLLYTYPYDMSARAADIREAVTTRSIDGIIHYTQSFCYRQIQDIVLRKLVQVPILTIEGEDPLPINDRLKIRIEAFIDMLR